MTRAFGLLMLVLTVSGISIRAAAQSTDTGPNEVRKLIRKAVNSPAVSRWSPPNPSCGKSSSSILPIQRLRSNSRFYSLNADA
ncbi:MAG: hypothetical protein IPI76_11720 [Chloracidobacterium sp.]|nr:hypothetical protein [Chloracidobacterium sp.]